MSVTTASVPASRRVSASKVPEVGVVFWVAKIMTTGMGETISDDLVHRFPPVPVVAVSGVVLAVALGLQFTADRYIPWRYWTACSMVSVFGTMVADVLHVQFNVPYLASTVFFLAALGVCFGSWRALEGTLSVHSIITRRRELFYWATVMITFALGTALGDMTAITLKLGYFSSGVMFTAAIAVPAIAFLVLRSNEVLAFWCAYVVTRPLGASFADWIGAPHSRGGLDFGFGSISAVLGLGIVVLVGLMSTGPAGTSAAGTPRTLEE